MRQTSDGGFVAVGWGRPDPVSDTYLRIIRTNTSGNVIFGRTFLLRAEGKKVVELADHGFLIAGYKPIGDSSQQLLLRINQYGDTLWTRTYGPGVITALIPSSRGTFVAAGYAEAPFAFEVNSSGVVIWNRSYDFAIGGEAYSVAQRLDGGLFLVGRSDAGINGYFDGFVYSLSSTGDTLWTRTYGSEEFDDGLYSSVITSGDALVMGGYVDDSVSHVMAIGSDGNVLWGNDWTVGYSLLDITAYGTGFALTGSARSAGPPYVDLGLIASGGNGETLWTQSLGVSNAYDRGFGIDQTIEGGLIVSGYKNCTNLGSGCGGQLFWLLRLGSATSSVSEMYPGLSNSIRVIASPNPFHGSTKIKFSSSASATLLFSVYDICGSLVFRRQLNLSGGSADLTWDAEPFAPGVYVYRVRNGSGVNVSGKLISVK